MPLSAEEKRERRAQAKAARAADDAARGITRQPAHRPPAGMQWDEHAAEWVPIGGSGGEVDRLIEATGAVVAAPPARPEVPPSPPPPQAPPPQQQLQEQQQQQQQREQEQEQVGEQEQPTPPRARQQRQQRQQQWQQWPEAAPEHEQPPEPESEPEPEPEPAPAPAPAPAAAAVASGAPAAAAAAVAARPSSRTRLEDLPAALLVSALECHVAALGGLASTCAAMREGMREELRRMREEREALARVEREAKVAAAEARRLKHKAEAEAAFALVGCDVVHHHRGGYTYHFTITNFNPVSRELTLEFRPAGQGESDDEIYVGDRRKWLCTCLCIARLRLPALRPLACPYCDAAKQPHLQYEIV